MAMEQAKYCLLAYYSNNTQAIVVCCSVVKQATVKSAFRICPRNPFRHMFRFIWEGLCFG